MILDKRIVLIPYIIPIIFIGNDVSNILLLIISSIYILMNIKHIKYINNRYIYSIMILITSAFISIIFVSSNMYSMSGMAIYLNALSYYLVFQIVKQKYNNNFYDFTQLLVYSIVGVNIFYLVIQLGINGERLSGIFGYANSLGILLLSFYLLNETHQFKYERITSIILLVLIFATGSRTTMLLLLGYIGYSMLIERKKKYIYSLALAGTIYILIAKLGVGGFLIAPIILFINKLINKIDSKYIVIISVIALFFVVNSSANTIERLKNISFENGSLQERIISFEDVIYSIKNNPLGKGINTYNFKSYEGASAFYSQKYIHNSLLSIGYEFGFIGMVAFIIFVIQVIKILASDKDKRYFIIAIMIFAHSLLDFDFAFSTIFIFISYLISNISDGCEFKINKKLSRVVTIGVILVYSYIAIYEVCLNINSEQSLSIAKNMYKKDYRSELYLSLICIEDENKNSLMKSLEHLNLAENLERDNPFIKWNLAYVYSKIGMHKNALEKVWEVLEIERYNIDAYELCNNILIEKYRDSDKNEYKLELHKLKEYYIKSLNEMNPRAKFIKNQLSENF